MKPVSTALASHLAGEVTTLATCWRLDRIDGWVRGFTDHDRNLVIDGVTYVAATGFLPSAIKSGSDLSVDNLDVDGFLDDDALKAEDLTAGLFDFFFRIQCFFFILEVVDDDLGILLAESHGHRASEPGGSPGDDDYFIL